MPRLKVMFKDQVQHLISLAQDEVIIGRASDCGIVIDNLGVSRHHAKITPGDDTYYIQDLGSSNGTFVNGKRIDRHELAPGDRVAVAKHTIIFEMWDAPGGQAAAPAPAAEAAPAMDNVNVTMQVDVDRVRRRSSGEEVKARYVLWETQSGKSFELKPGETMLGKASTCQVPVKGLFVGGVHAVISNKDEKFSINHLSGWKAVTVNGRKVKQADLNNLDVIRIGAAEFKLLKMEK